MTPSKEDNSTLEITNANAAESMIELSKVNGLIKSISASGAKLVENIQIAAIQALLYAQFKDNFEPASQLMLVCLHDIPEENGFKLRRWFEQFGPFAWRQTEDKNYPEGYKFRKSKSENANPFDPVTASNTPWQTFGDNPEGTASQRLFSVDSFITRMKRLVKDMEKTLEDDSKLDSTKPEEDKASILSIKDSLSSVLSHYEPENDNQSNENAKKAA